MESNVKFSKLELMQGRVYFVPDGWQLLHTSRAYKIRNQLRLPISEGERAKQQGNYPYYGPTKIQDHISTYQQDGEYVLIGEDGDHFLKYRSAPMTQLVKGKCTVNNHAHILEGTKKASREWFYYYFMHRDIFSFLTRQGAGRYKLNKRALEQLPVLIPPRPEQKKIAKILSTWDEAIVTTEQLLAISQEQKKALMQQLLTGKKRFPGFKGEWKEKKLGEIISEIKRKRVINPDNHELLTVKLHLNGVVRSGKKPNSTEGGRPYYHRYEGELIIGRQNLHNGGIAIVGKDTSGCIASNAISSFDTIADNDLKFMLYRMSIPSFLFKVDNLTGGTGQKEVSTKALLGITIPIPSFTEQKTIAVALNTADTEITTLQQKLDRLKQEKKALMQQLLTGKRRVKI